MVGLVCSSLSHALFLCVENENNAELGFPLLGLIYVVFVNFFPFVLHVKYELNFFLLHTPILYVYFFFILIFKSRANLQARRNEIFLSVTFDFVYFVRHTRLQLLLHIAN